MLVNLYKNIPEIKGWWYTMSENEQREHYMHREFLLNSYTNDFDEFKKNQGNRLDSDWRE